MKKIKIFLYIQLILVFCNIAIANDNRIYNQSFSKFNKYIGFSYNGVFLHNMNEDFQSLPISSDNFVNDLYSSEYKLSIYFIPNSFLNSNSINRLYFFSELSYLNIMQSGDTRLFNSSLVNYFTGVSDHGSILFHNNYDLQGMSIEAGTGYGLFHYDNNSFDLAVSFEAVKLFSRTRNNKFTSDFTVLKEDIPNANYESDNSLNLAYYKEIPWWMLRSSIMFNYKYFIDLLDYNNWDFLV